MFHGADRRDFVAHLPDRAGGRADKQESAGFDPLGEIRIFRQESVARVDRDRISHFGRTDDRGHVQVAFRGRRRADADGLVREKDVLQIVVGGGVNGHRLDAHFLAGAHHAQCNLAAIGNDDFFEHSLRARLVSAALVDDEQDLPVLDRLAILHTDGFDRAGDLGLDLVHHFHRLDDAERVTFVDTIADLHEGR